MALNYNIKGTGVDISDELRTYVEKKLSASDKFVHTDAAHADVELEHAANKEGKKYRAEFTLALGSDVHRAEAHGDALHEAIDIAAGELARDLSQTKKKRQHVFRRSAMRVKEYIRGFRRSV